MKENQLVSSAADNKIKMWDVSGDSKKPINTFHVNSSPVWKVKFTPFGEGLVTLSHSVPNGAMREPNNLMLWNWSVSPMKSNRGPVHKFYNHMDAVQEFAWRNVDPLNDRKDFELVTWGRDSMLTLWKIGGHLKEMCGEEEETDAEVSSIPWSPLSPLISFEHGSLFGPVLA